MRTLEGRLCLTGVVAMCALVAALPGSAGATVSVVRGSSYGSRIFPDNAFTVADKTQATGRRLSPGLAALQRGSGRRSITISTVRSAVART